MSIFSAEKNSFKAKIISSEIYAAQRALVDTAFCAIAKGDRNETITENLSQIGVHQVIFWQSQHSIPKPPYEKKLQKLKKLTLESAVQCGRAEPIKVSFIEKHEQLLNALSACPTPILMCSLRKDSSPLHHVIQSDLSYSFITGPEGDFSEEEFSLIHPLCSHSVTLGENILKTDTAAIVTASMIMALTSNKLSS